MLVCRCMRLTGLPSHDCLVCNGEGAVTSVWSCTVCGTTDERSAACFDPPRCWNCVSGLARQPIVFRDNDYTAVR